MSEKKTTTKAASTSPSKVTAETTTGYAGQSSVGGQTTGAQTTPTPKKKGHTGLIIAIIAIVAIVGLISLVPVLIGGWIAKNSAETFIEGIARTQGVDLDLNTSKDGINIKTKDGDFSLSGGASKSLADDFPKNELTLIPGEIAYTGRMKTGSNTIWTVSINAKDTFANTVTQAKTSLENQGWTIDSEMEAGEFFIGAASKELANGDKLHTNFTVTQDDKTTTVGYQVTQSESEQ